MMKKMFMLRTLSLALVLMLALSAVSGLVACRPDDGGEENPDDVLPEDALVLMDADTLTGIYSVIRSDVASTKIKQLASKLRVRLMSYYGASEWNIDTDWVNDENEAEIAARFEILVGESERPESRQVLAELGEEQYAIRVVGNKLVIIGVDERHTIMAVNYFMNTYLSEGSAYIPKDLSVLKTEVYVAQSTANGPIIVNTLYSNEDVVVADIYLSEDDYGVDPTGEQDSTAAIQNALNECQRRGGGTVFLPAGLYRITKSISIPSFVCLRGDWQNPDSGNEYGTVILADVKSQTTVETGLFVLGGSAGAYGLTVYYPEQSVESPKPYPPTFFVRLNTPDGFMASTIKNVTLINSYEGVRTHATNNHEQLTVENFYGSFTSIGMYLTNSSDVGTCTNISILPKYWAEFTDAMGYEKVSEEQVRTYMRAHTEGLVLGDLEWTEFIHMIITDCKYGIHIVDGERASFAGSFYDTIILDCDVGLQADDMDARWGMHLSNCYVSGSKYGIINHSAGLIKTAGTSILGGMKGTVLVDDDSLSEYAIDTGRSYIKPVEKLYTDTTLDQTGKTDISQKLQALLDEAGKTGGVVYLPAGLYLLANPVTVPTGVELRGCLPITQREQINMSKGTMIHVTYGLGGDEDDTAAVTLSAASGINGIRFQYHQNNGALRETSYCVRGTGKDVYLVYCSFVAGGRGVDFSNCDNHFIKKLTTFCYINDIRVGGKNGCVTGMLHNCTVMDRHGMGVTYPPTEGYPSNNHVARVYNTSILVENATDQLIYNCFSYGVAHLIRAVDSTNTLAVNIGADNIGDKTHQLVLDGGSFVGVNILRFNGYSCDYTKGTRVKLYSRLAIGERREETLIVN